MQTYRGSCHCGAIRFEADGELTGLDVCNCSLCGRTGFIHWYVTPDRFRLLTPEEPVCSELVSPVKSLMVKEDPGKSSRPDHPRALALELEPISQPWASDFPWLGTGKSDPTSPASAECREGPANDSTAPFD